ncbi:alpha/beta hydrolase [Polaribacter reichenbachii]|uniref:Alpha/beta hydrolase n=1 Tax=Polaribacter reichenbachii TaxID=996801 RepID=A0A1B8TU72_9FLAO|nr:alpha/beta fold hydrolase [Polaribacter reichenbachii]APZ45734.1 alpha/beta hydrolase [Polaribacter reichenbachii]AUC19595.1 alpha/beta hydrolase [Polaribacter reichenbachii]OBY63251.1 alpha/beta hydrolase [Polaribacter reichenbachii]
MKILKNIIVEGTHQKPIVTDVFYKPTNQPKKVVIFCHGYKGFKDWGPWNLLAEKFANAGFFFIKFNFSHNGGTAEQPIDFPDLEAFGNNNYTKELDDLKSVIDWISNAINFRDEANINDISIVGHSRGGGIVLLKANEDARVKKVITLASVCDFGKRSSTIGDLENWQKNGVKYVVNGRTHQKMPHFIQFYNDYKLNENRLNIPNAVKNLKIPQLIIHGNKDDAVFISEGENLKKWNPAAQFSVIENANHVFNASHPWEKETLSKELEEVVHLCVDFIKK